ncbi:hypothetical protein ALC57_10169 [Trachymyrmex cornetzi]|uniref:Uncharacterized protein n=1 Tax=Trachymyrmex cornetzi TaxID=471704 RepID=A0A151J4K3_9HYME|nr:hypothetical protein ALC57_10169 [Trachymyrmex cornetzi]
MRSPFDSAWMKYRMGRYCVTVVSTVRDEIRVKIIEFDLQTVKVQAVKESGVLVGALFENYGTQLASTNLVGKFTQSVRRIVQDVKDEGTSSGQTKEEVIETNERLRVVRIRLDGSYDTAKRALVELMCKYTDSKQVRNVFQRYNLLKNMIKVAYQFTSLLQTYGLTCAPFQALRAVLQLIKDEGNRFPLAVPTLLTPLYPLRRNPSEGSYRSFTWSCQFFTVKLRTVPLERADVIKLETQYWTLVDIPRQEKQETVPAFVLRACSIMEKTHKSGEGVKTSARLAEEAETKRERIERLENMTTAQIEAENTQMTNDLYRLLKKYTGLRNLIKVLKEEYNGSKLYPMFPRYTILKDMIKDIMHNPDYMEVCHEVDQA